MIDVARQHHDISVLKQCVLLCYLYKLNYLQLHLTDDQSFTFPSKAYPQLSAKNPNGSKAYTREELLDLVHFADHHGVTIIPEMDLPGHSARLVAELPDLFKIRGTKPYEHHATINFAKHEVLRAVETLIGEMCDVFKSSPYFHMGGDEADISLADQSPEFQSAFKELGLPPHSQQELFRRFISQVGRMVKRCGKKLLVWEGFGQDKHSRFPIPKDVQVMEFENSYYMPQDLLKDGYTLINASWTPLYVVNRHVWPAKVVYDWDLSKFGRYGNLLPTTQWFNVQPTKNIIGAQACSWEGPGSVEVQTLRRIVPAMAERLWNGSTKTPYSNFATRLSATDNLLERLVQPVQIGHSQLDAVDPNGFDVACFTKPLQVQLSSEMGEAIRYTLDGSEPTGSSKLYVGPFEITDTATVRARTFHRNGVASEFESAKTFYYVPANVPNLAAGKHVTASSGTQHPQEPELAVDGNLDLASSWWAAPGPQWLKVDLGNVYPVGSIEVFPYWDGHRYYQYTVEVSPDGTSWHTVLDRSHNTIPASNQGDRVSFAATQARYVRVNMLRGSANEGVHLVELRVFEAK
jgi:N-acetyl-beta-hexosaminidase